MTKKNTYILIAMCLIIIVSIIIMVRCSKKPSIIEPDLTSLLSTTEDITDITTLKESDTKEDTTEVIVTEEDTTTAEPQITEPQTTAPEITEPETTEAPIVTTPEEITTPEVTTAIETEPETTIHIHSYIVVSTIEPTCMSEGGIEKRCEECGENITEFIPRIPHTPSAWIIEGNTMTKICMCCGEILETQIEDEPEDPIFARHLSIPDLGIELELKEVDMYEKGASYLAQQYVDEKNVAALLLYKHVYDFYDYDVKIIADHRYQGFKNLPKIKIGTVADICGEKVVCRETAFGVNDGDLLLNNNEDAMDYSDSHEYSYMMYTCYGDEPGIFIAFFK